MPTTANTPATAPLLLKNPPVLALCLAEPPLEELPESPAVEVGGTVTTTTLG